MGSEAADAVRAPRPVILSVDDDPEVLRAVGRDLRRQYASRHRVVTAESGEAALGALGTLAERGEPVALAVADQRMPGMSGVELLREGKALFPDLKTVLLTAYADTDAAIGAINEVRLDYYVLKPWEPPEERLYPVLDDLLSDWHAGYRAPFAGVRLVGHRFSADSHRLRELLARNQIPFQWLDVEQDGEARELVGDPAGEPTLPLVVMPDGRRLSGPSNAEVAAAVGLSTRSEARFFDLLVVGGGPAGLAAAVYGASEGLSTCLVERESPGGQAGSSARIENYLGFPAGLSGGDLTRRALTQARRFGAEILSLAGVAGLGVRDTYRLLRLEDGTELSANAAIVATGVSYRRLEVPGADALTGAGVYYGASTAEAPGFRGERVAVVGGGNSAGQCAVHFSRYAERVTLVVRSAPLERSMSSYLIEQVRAIPSIDVRLGCRVTAVHGDERLSSLELIDAAGAADTIDVSGLFVFIGARPHTDWLPAEVGRDHHGFVLTGPQVAGNGWPERRDPLLLETSVPGVFAAGDVRSRSVKRVASAVGEGAIAVHLVHQYLRR